MTESRNTDGRKANMVAMSHIEDLARRIAEEFDPSNHGGEDAYFKAAA